MNITPKQKHWLPSLVIIFALFSAHSAVADELVSKSRNALQQLVAQNSAAATCKSKAFAVLVFPEVMKAGFHYFRKNKDGKRLRLACGCCRVLGHELLQRVTGFANELVSDCRVSTE